ALSAQLDRSRVNHHNWPRDSVAPDLRALASPGNRRLLRPGDYVPGWRRTTRSGFRSTPPHWRGTAAVSRFVAPLDDLERPRIQRSDGIAAARSHREPDRGRARN